MKKLFTIIALITTLWSSTVDAAHFTVATYSDLTAASLHDTGFVTSGEGAWYVYDGTTWIPCKDGACALAVKSSCDPASTTSIGITGNLVQDWLIVAGVAGKKVISCGGYIIPAGTVSVKFVRSGGANPGTCNGTDANLTEAVPLTAQVGHMIPAGIETVAGDSFCMNLAQAIAVTGVLIYYQEP